jgi:hypothetical protein
VVLNLLPIIDPLTSLSPGWKVYDDAPDIVVGTGGPNLKIAHSIGFDRRGFHSPIVAWRMDENL